MNRVLVIDQDSATTTRTPREMATLLARVAPRVSLVVAVWPETSLDTRVALELGGFRVLTKPVTVEELVEKVPGR